MNEPIPQSIIWAILCLPLASFAATIVLATVRPEIGRRYPRLAGHITIAAIGVAFVLAIVTLIGVIAERGHAIGFEPHTLFSAGPLTVEVGARIDGLSGIMLVVVTGVSLMVQIYSLGYMKGDGGFRRYYAYMSLFTAAMLGLVMADNLLLLFVFWELVGLTSYLLIGFWFHRSAAAAAAKKAFLVTRTGDLGLLAATLLIWDRGGTLNIHEINTDVIELVAAGGVAQTALTLFALGLVAGAVGKSAQFPLHTWLPDAMEGPTPVSGLVHSATMVAAGVYLLARFFPVLEHSHLASDLVAWIGAITAVGAALLAVTQTDIKRVLAYSTISQLAYMIFALGTGAYAAAVFHLTTHAFFKALLFLGAGSVSHSTNTFDMKKMGGLRHSMPLTYVMFIVGALSLSGIIPLAGFWSKDEILIDTWHHNKAIFFFGLFAAGLTAFYMFRAIFMTFHGDYRGGEPVLPGEHGNEDPAHPHESPRSMVLPMGVLMMLAVVAGFITIDGEIQTWLLNALPEAAEEAKLVWNTPIFIVSTLLALTGIGIAYLGYEAKRIDLTTLRDGPLRPLHQLLENKYYMDVLIEDILVRKLFYGGLANAAAVFDRVAIDGVVDFAGSGTLGFGRVARHVQNGQVQTAGAALVMGGVIIFGIVVIF